MNTDSIILLIICEMRSIIEDNKKQLNEYKAEISQLRHQLSKLAEEMFKDTK